MSASIGLENGGTRAVITPTTDLEKNTVYYVLVSGDVQDEAGNPMGSVYVGGSFTTILPDTAPTIFDVSVDTTQTGATITFTSSETGKGKAAYYLDGITPTETSYVDVTAATPQNIVLSGLTCGTTYNYIVYAKDAVGNETQTDSNSTTFATAPCPIGTLAVNSVSMIKISGTADDSYENGWEWVLRITLPSTEPLFAMKFSNWTSGANTLLAGGNMRYCSEQIADGENGSCSIGSLVKITDANTYPDYVIVTEDADPSRPGIQTDVHVQVKIPSGTAGGSYGASYGLESTGID